MKQPGQEQTDKTSTWKEAGAGREKEKTHILTNCAHVHEVNVFPAEHTPTVSLRGTAEGDVLSAGRQRAFARPSTPRHTPQSLPASPYGLLCAALSLPESWVGHQLSERQAGSFWVFGHYHFVHSLWVLCL